MSQRTAESDTSMAEGDDHRQRLCQMCRQFLAWDKLQQGKLESGDFFSHYSTASELGASATKRCHLCVLLLQALTKGRHPEGETRLPDRQVRITLKYPDLTVGALYLNVSIEPGDLSEAGLHDIEKLDQKFARAILSDPEADDELIKSLVESLSASPLPSGSKYTGTLEETHSETIVYFKEGVVVSADEFFAFTMPFYNADLELEMVLPVVDMILERSTEIDDLSTGSDSTLVLVAHWLAYCERAHKFCNLARKQPNQTPQLPKRVLDLDALNAANDRQGSVVLVCPTPGCRSDYVTLSHCWGEKQIIRTTTETISAHTAGIAWESLPRTFQEAIDVCRRLSYRFLWIDSLCIIQDSKEDWKEESSKMGDIYRNATLCISALDARDSSEGLYRPRDGLLQRPCRMWDAPPVGLCIPEPHGTGPAPIYVTTAPPAASEDGQLTHRGWVLQEELLSGRRLIFGPEDLSWSCLTMQVSTGQPQLVFGTPDKQYNNGRYDWQQYFQAAIGSLLEEETEGSNSDMGKVHQCWMLLVENYSRRRLTKGSDKLTALAGVAREFELATGDTYVIGLWRRFLWRQLIWSVSSEGAPLFDRPVPHNSKEPQLEPEFACPSWSWARIDGDINYFHIRRIDEMSDHRVMVEILDAETTPAGASAISHSYLGLLRLHGYVQAATVEPFSERSKSLELDEFMKKGKPGQGGHDDQTPDPVELEKESMESYLASLDEERRGVFGEEPGPAPSQPGTSDDAAADESAEPDFMQNWAAYRRFVNDAFFSPMSAYEDYNDAHRYNPDAGFLYTTLDSVYPGHPVFDPETGDQVGYWAPDLTCSKGRFDVVCLPISSSRQMVFCLGLEPVQNTVNRYRRIGLVFWIESKWNEKEMGARVTVEIE